MVQIVNISDSELEQINQLFLTVEQIVNERRLWEIETIIQTVEEGMQGVIQAYISMIVNNYEKSLARFRIYPRYMKKMTSGEIRIHSTTRISPTANQDITWVLISPTNEFQKLVISEIITTTVPIYATPQFVRTEIPKLDENWQTFMKAKKKVEQINNIFMALKEEYGAEQAQTIFNDKEQFDEELDDLFGFLEGEFKIVAHIAVIGVNIEGLKGIVMREEEGYDIIFDGFRELEALEKLTDPLKMSEKEYLDLLYYIWDSRTCNTDVKVLIKVEKESARIVYQIRKRTKQEKYEPKSTQKISEKSSNQPKTVSGERTRQKPMSEAIPSPSQNSQRVSGERTRKKEVYSSAKESERKKE